MITNSNRTLFLKSNFINSQYITKYIDFLSIDVNFLYLDFSNNKDVLTSKVNHQRVNITNISDIILGNLRNVDHIIIDIPLGYNHIFLDTLANILHTITVKYSVITHSINSNITKFVKFDECYLLNENSLTNIVSENELYFENFKKEYIRIATINDILK